MSFTLPSRSPSGPRRRSLLASAAGAGAALLTGCSASDSSSETTQESSSAADRARARAARDSEGLAARYEAVLAAHPALAARLSPLRAEVVRHAEAFGGGRRASATPSASAPSSPTASESAAASSVPVREEDALAELASAERALADRRTKALEELPGEPARLLASVAAAGAVHVYLLTEGRK
ncbi:lipoprotein [Streptomyces pseudoechinosporeus]